MEAKQLDVIGEMDHKLDMIDAFTKKAASAIVFVLLLDLLFTALILSEIIWRNAQQ